jgi:hypothetical protein
MPPGAIRVWFFGKQMEFGIAESIPDDIEIGER